jgi:ferric-dicitrate binding protein FerR (iron transport regulator)
LTSSDEHFDVLDDAKKIVDHVDTYQLPSIDKQALFAKINSDISNKVHPPKNKSWLRYIAAGVILIGIVVAIFIYLNNGTQIETPHHKHFKHRLPDNSEVQLNANSQLVYENDFIENRKLTLKGEAFFKVEKGSSFVVETELGNVEVLGTSFNVLAQKDAFKVSCKTGRVKVTIKNDEYILTPGKEVIYYNSKTVQKTISESSINQWENGISSFDKSPLAMVVRSLQDWYGIDIKLDDKHSFDEFTGSFVQDDLEKALKMVFLPMGLKYEIKDNNLVLIQD